MVILQFEHTVPDFAAWKQLFDRDPLGRQQSGARRVRLVRPIDEPGRVMVELDFDSAPEAAAFQDRLQSLWDRNQDSILQPRAAPSKWSRRTPTDRPNRVSPQNLLTCSCVS